MKNLAFHSLYTQVKDGYPANSDHLIPTFLLERFREIQYVVFELESGMVNELARAGIHKGMLDLD